MQQRYDSRATSAYDRSLQSGRNTQSVAKTVFGYDIDKTAFQKESYLSKILNDRLEPYMNKRKESSAPKHQTFTINHPISLKY